MEYIKRVQGGLLGMALGDAFGYPIERMSCPQIIDRYGEKGMCDFELQDGYACFSDDTQLALYSADGITSNTEELLDNLYNRYFDWLYTQFNLMYKDATMVYQPSSKLVEIPELNELRRPNLTCLNTLFKCQMGSEVKPLNDSCDIGSLVRSGPLIMYLAKRYDLSHTAKLVMDASYITHGHKLCAISTYYLAAIMHRIINTKDSLSDIFKLGLDDVEQYFKDIEEFRSKVNYALELIYNSSDDVTNIESIGVGYMAHEAIAITLYVVAKYKDDFKKALYVGANHGGKSDTISSLVGMIIGFYYGIDIIPDTYLDIVELGDLLFEYAEKIAK